MPITTLDHETLLGFDKSQHFASEPHIRIQMIEVKRSVGTSDLFSFHGEVLVICQRGTIIGRTATETHSLREKDQLLFTGGDPFALEIEPKAAAAAAQLIWTPGPNPCKVCWQTASRFFS